MTFSYLNYWGIANDPEVLPEFVKAQAENSRRYKLEKMRFGDVLIERGLTKNKELDRWHDQKPEGVLFGDFLSTLNEVPRGLKDAILPAIAASAEDPLLFIGSTEFAYVGVSDALKDADVRKECSLYRCLILNIGNRAFLAFAGLSELKQWSQLGYGSKVKSAINSALAGDAPFCIADPSLIAEVLDSATDGHQLHSEEDIWKEAELESSGAEAQVWITQTLNYAIKEGASDIHITPDDSVVVKVRVDGHLKDVPAQNSLTMPLYHDVRNWLVSKSHATKDGAPVYTPVDGEAVSYMPKVGSGRSLRLSFVPMGSGGGAERKPVRIVFRLHPLRSQLKEDNVKTIGELGIYDKTAEQVLREIVELRGGMVIMAGPMGSGKTTTMYAVLKAMVEHYMGSQCIASVEDPIEQELKGVDQIELSRKAKEDGYGYAEYLKALKRQDTNILYLGEIRDEETAVYAGQFGSIGNTVLTTVHAKTESQTMIRLRAMIPRTEDFELLVSGIEYVLSQRLVRQLCSSCKTSRDITDADKDWVEKTLKRYSYSRESAKAAAGALTTISVPGTDDCKVCKNSRSENRLPIIGILPITDELRDLMLDRSVKTAALRQALNAGRVTTMTEQALSLISKGLVALEELNHG